MELLEFIKQKNRMCDYHCGKACTHDDSGKICPAYGINCDTMTDQPEQLVAIVEKWAKEHPEESKQEEAERNDTANHRTESIQLTIEDRLRMLEQDMRIMENFRHDTLDKIHEIEEHAAHQDTLMQKKCVHVDSAKVEPMNELKRTNKDVLLAVFPDVRMEDSGIPDVCPRALDKNYNNCKDYAIYSVCRCAYWLAEEDE